MKYITIIALMLCSIASFAQDTPPVEEQKEWMENVDYIYDKTTEAISQMADALAVPAGHVYYILVKQQVAFAAAYSSLIIFGIVFLIAFLKTLHAGNADFRKRAAEWREAYYEKRYGYGTPSRPTEWGGGYIGGSVVLALMATGLLIGGLVHIEEIFIGFINPEYGAIKEILSIF